ncbi:hypothetical protein AB0J71_32975 [Nonomuraea sp. NPDC049637]|uniref:hypothetical protein n=1 Tax=Nonomuraea sp. NPDC049637 TaxID=3154356 RepID=UPI00341650E2
MGNRLATWPETRMCAAVTASTNLALIVNLHSFEHLEELLIRAARLSPGVAVAERRLILRQVKIYGRVVDEDGRCLQVIPPTHGLRQTCGREASSRCLPRRCTRRRSRRCSILGSPRGPPPGVHLPIDPHA